MSPYLINGNDIQWSVCNGMSPYLINGNDILVPKLLVGMTNSQGDADFSL